ncbi:MAG: anticodon nuclease, partial [Tissierellia bacterium]|nr:anticodon nuclease [Tissierellia bacterium]
MKEFNSLKALTKEIKGTKISQTFEQRIIKKKKISLIYAFNSTGKTRISEEFNKLGAEKVLCFNAFIQDLFTWNNKDRVLKIEANSEIMRQISEQGLENDITNNFRELINNKIDPIFNLENGEISFDIVTGDDNVEQGIKISRGEESIFVWSVFYSVLSTAIFAINDKKEDRTTDEFD